MNAQNFTQKSLEAVQTAQAMAQENRNNYIMPEHLLYALIDQDGGLIPSLLGKMGADFGGAGQRHCRPAQVGQRRRGIPLP